MGRFPSRALLQGPETQGLGEHFEPLCRLIVRGDYIAFREHLAFDAPTAQWFAKKGILLTLRNRCEILVWRSFCRKIFIQGGFHGDMQAQAQRGPPPYLYLDKLEAATKWLQSQHEKSTHTAIGNPNSKSIYFGSQTISLPTDPDFIGLETLESVMSVPNEKVLETYGDFLAPDGFFDETGHWQNNVPGELIDGVPELDYEGCEMNTYTEEGLEDGEPTLIMQELESILASLLTQGLMRGYLTHRRPRFAIPGARARGALPTGFPNVWQTILAREGDDDSVPGWVKPAAPAAVGAPVLSGGGRVVNLAGAKPVGMT